MRLPHLRLTVGRLLVAVAVVALILATYSAYRRSQRHRALARMYAAGESEFKGIAEMTRNTPGIAGLLMQDSASRTERLADYFGRRRAAHERVASRPWLPDPPYEPPPE